MPRRKKIKKFIITSSITSLALMVTLLISAGVLWQRGWLQPRLQDWLQRRVIAKIIKDLQPKLPFIIESYDYDANWADLKKGKLDRLRLTLKWGEYRIRLSGPIQIDENKTAEEISLSYQPLTTLEPVKFLVGASEVTTPLPLDLFAKVPSHLQEISDLKELGINAHTGNWKWPLHGIELTNLNLMVDWRDHLAQVKVSTKTLAWADPKNSDHAVNIESPAVAISAPLLLQPLSIGTDTEPSIDVKLSGKSGEFLWGDTYLDLDFKKQVLDTRILLKNATAPLELAGANLSIGEGHHENLTLRTMVRGPSEYETRWKTRQLPVPELLKSFATVLPKAFAKLGFRDGTLETEGRATLTSHEIRRAQGKVSLENLTMFDKSAAILIRGLKLWSDFSTEHGIENGRLEIPELWFHQFKAKLNPTEFSLAVLKGEKKLLLPKGIPLEVAGVPLKIGPVQGVFTDATSQKASDFEFKTDVGMSEIPLENITRGLCEKKTLPPASLAFHLSPVEISSTDIETTGALTAKLFDGTIKLEDPSIYDMTSAVPETNFNLSWDGIELATLGKWSNFGKMDGTIAGYAEDVVFQSWLPTQFNFKFQLKPHLQKKIVFSTDAMRNLVRVLSGPEALDSLPTYANWVAFGWPARLFGGYDVDYFGISAFSTDSVILVETLDPPGTKKTDDHYILRGMRFKIPLKTPRYPLVVDAVFMSNYIHTLLGNLHHVSTANAEEQQKIKSDDSKAKEPENAKSKNDSKKSPAKVQAEPITTSKEENDECLPPYSLYRPRVSR